MARRLAVLAGSGDLVGQVVEAALRAGDKVQVLALGERAPLPGVKQVRGDVSQPLGIVWSVRSFRATHLVMAGGIHLSDRQREGLARFVSGESGAGAPAQGDAAMSGLGTALRRITGAELIGVHDVAPELVAGSGLIAGPQPEPAALAAGRLGMSAAQTIGRLDLGQAVVVSGGRVVAAEDVGGTDELLRRVAGYRDAELIGDGQGPLVLAKASKPQQPAYIDLPAIGPDTIRNAAAAGIALIAVEPLRTLLIDRPRLLAAAAAAGITIYGMHPDG